MRRSTGRPNKNRNKANDEPRIRNTLPRTFQTVNCKKCGSFGHNKQTCKGKRAAERAIPKDDNKKPKKRGDKSGKEAGQTVIDGGQTVIDGGSQAPPPIQE
ncbi:unnamed protein product [Lathyrus sativus]|nr:unnamed protein product [Lathyrus sativus]